MPSLESSESVSGPATHGASRAIALARPPSWEADSGPSTLSSKPAPPKPTLRRPTERLDASHSMSRLRLIPYSFLVLVFASLLVGCDEVMDLPEAGDSGTVRAPSTIIGRVLVIHLNGEVIAGNVECLAGKHNPRTARLWFVDQSTIRGVRDDGTFDQPTNRWEYEKTSTRTGTIQLWWENGNYDDFHLTFVDDSSGSWVGDSRRAFPNACGDAVTRSTGEFEIEDPQ